MKKLPCFWVNGKVYESEHFPFSPYNHGLTTGDGIFETIPVYKGKVLGLKEHLERALKSAAGMGIPLKEYSSLEKGVHDLLIANKMEEIESAKIRLTVTCGDAPLGSNREPSSELLSVIAMLPFQAFSHGTRVELVPWIRNENSPLTGLKTISYGENVVALAYANERSATEALFLNSKGHICEGTGSNLFWIKNQVLYTPCLTTGCLAGITRSFVLRLAQQLNIETKELSVSAEDFLSCDEAFLTSSLREVQSIKQVGTKKLPCELGPVTQKLFDAYQSLKL